MARGQQKIQAQMKNAERQAKLKKAQKSGVNQKDMGKAALKITCPVRHISIIYIFDYSFIYHFINFLRNKNKLISYK